MKKKYTYILLLSFFFVCTAFIITKYVINRKEKAATFYTLLERKGALANSAEWTSKKMLAYRLNNTIRRKPDDNKTALALATLYIQESRITGNYMYYDAAAMKYIKDVLSREPENLEAMVLQSVIYLSQHHFADGLAIAEKAQKVNPYYSFVYGLLVDGNVEMGNYKAAVENSDKMVSIRPDIRSYSRISYLREIHGDNQGAIEAMKMAVQAGGYGDEPTEWARVQLGRLYENTGDLKSAEMHYTIALDERPDFAYAIAGLGHVALAQHNYNKAIKLYEQASSLLTDYSIHQQLASLYLLTRNKDKARSTIQELIEELNNDAKKGEQDESIGHYADRELAYAYLLNNDVNSALKHALLEYNRRPDNIDVNETVAWVYHSEGKDEKALPYIQTALKTHCKNPTLLCHAGLIYAAAGNKSQAKLILQEALKNNPNIDADIKNESEKALRSLQS